MASCQIAVSRKRDLVSRLQNFHLVEHEASHLTYLWSSKINIIFRSKTLRYSDKEILDFSSNGAIIAHKGEEYISPGLSEP